MTKKEKLSEYIELLYLLDNREIKPDKIVGTGLKCPRKCAYKWLGDKIAEYIN